MRILPKQFNFQYDALSSVADWFSVSRQLALITTQADCDYLSKVHDGGDIYNQMGIEAANDRVQPHVKT
jgi:hypothetical protein